MVKVAVRQLGSRVWRHHRFQRHFHHTCLNAVTVRRLRLRLRPRRRVLRHLHRRLTLGAYWWGVALCLLMGLVIVPSLVLVRRRVLFHTSCAVGVKGFSAIVVTTRRTILEHCCAYMHTGATSFRSLQPGCPNFIKRLGGAAPLLCLVTEAVRLPKIDRSCSG